MKTSCILFCNPISLRLSSLYSLSIPDDLYHSMPLSTLHWYAKGTYILSIHAFTFSFSEVHRDRGGTSVHIKDKGQSSNTIDV